MDCDQAPSTDGSKNIFPFWVEMKKIGNLPTNLSDQEKENIMTIIDL